MILIIAFGNDLREDDGAGLVLARLLQKTWQTKGVAARLVSGQQLVPELAVDISQQGVAAVVFVDTRVAQSPDDCEVTVVPVAGPESAPRALGHCFDPGLVLAYARVLAGESVPPAWLVTVPGTRFEYGPGLSVDAANAIRRALQDQNSALRAFLRTQIKSLEIREPAQVLADHQLHPDLLTEERPDDRDKRPTHRPQGAGTPATGELPETPH